MTDVSDVNLSEESEKLLRAIQSAGIYPVDEISLGTPSDPTLTLRKHHLVEYVYGEPTGDYNEQQIIGLRSSDCGNAWIRHQSLEAERVARETKRFWIGFIVNAILALAAFVKSFFF